MSAPLPRRLHLPKEDRAHWRPAADTSIHDLLYLAWGERRYGEAPVPCSRHQGWVYVACESGSPTLVTENARLRFEAGTALILGPDHAFGWQDQGRRTCRLLVWMWREPATGFLPKDRPAHFQRVAVSRPALVRLRWLHTACLEEVRLSDAVMPATLAGLHRVTETTVVREGLTSPDHDQAALRANLAVRWMESHLDSRQPAARIADYLGLSPSTLHRIFKREFGRSPDAHFLALKMVAAKHALAAGGPVKQVAFSLGYRHAGDLTRAFKRHFGTAPTEAGFRRNATA